jgi:hypothetical protein
MTPSSHPRFIRILIASVAALAGPLFAEANSENPRSPTVASTKLSHDDSESLEKLTEEDRQAYTEALDYIRSVVSGLKALSAEEKEKTLVLLCARKSALEIIVMGNLLRVLVLDKAADTQFAHRMAKEEPRYRASLAAEASERTAWAIDTIRRYLGPAVKGQSAESEAPFAR